MRTVLAPLLLAAAAAAPLAASADEVPTPRTQTVQVVVERGRVVLDPGQEGEVLMPSEEEHALKGPAVLEVGAGARVELAWVGRMSLLVDGPARLRLPKVTADAAPECHVVSARRVEWESRAAGATLALSEGWTLTLDRGATRLEDAPAGAVDVRHHGGVDLRVGSGARRTPGTWPARLAAGCGARLGPKPAR